MFSVAKVEMYNFKTVLALLFLCYFKFAQPAHILAVWTTPVTSPSVTFGFSAITQALRMKGHNVTLLTETSKQTRGFPIGSFSQTMKYKSSYNLKYMDEFTVNFTRVNQEGFNGIEGMRKMIRHLVIVRDSLINSCKDLIKDKKMMERLKETKFDLVILVPMCPCDVLISKYVDAPFVSLLTSIRIFSMHEGVIGMPYPSAYVPFNPVGYLTDDMTFFQRIQNLFSPLFFKFIDYVIHSPFEELKVAFSIDSDISFEQLYSESLLFLSHTGVGTDFPRPTTPNFVPIGGLVARPGKPLPEDLNEFIEGSGEDGFILFTMGSVTKGIFNEETAETLAAVFKKLPQRVLWRHDAKIPSNLGSNTKIVKWLPQNDVLAHPKIKLFIYHGGSNGVYEGVYHGVPMIIMPMGGDQLTHAARVQRKGMGVMMDLAKLNEENLVQNIQEVINNPVYREKAQHFSAIEQDSPQTALERAVYWIEHVIKFGGAHLRPPSADMSTIKLYMIDVGVFLAVIFLIGMYIYYLLVRKCLSCCCGKKNSKKPKNKKKKKE